MNYMHLYKDAVTDGPGIRVSIYISGCRNKCKGCHNPDSWNFLAGKEYTEETENEALKALNYSGIEGLTICGGEPMEEENQRGILSLARKAKELYPEKDIWCYTGYEFADLVSGGRKHIEVTDELLSYIDVMVVGPFILEQRDISENNLWRGSLNQRVIDVQKSIKAGKPIPVPDIVNNEIKED